MHPISVVGAPSSAGAFSPGQEKAPAELRSAGILEALAIGGRIVNDRGNTTSRRWSADRSSPFAQNIAQVRATVEELDQLASQSLADGTLTLVLGGDCSIGAGSVRALSRHSTRPGLVYLDLDPDMNVPGSSREGALDWMGTVHMLGLPAGFRT